MSIASGLREFGFSDKESLVYLALLELGVSKASKISKKTGLLRPTVYDVLETLLLQGFVGVFEKRGVKHYTAVHPESLRLKVIEKQGVFDRLLPQLLSHRAVSDSKPTVRFYEGVSGIKQVFEETLLAKDKQLRGILSMSDLYLVPGKEYMDGYVKRRVEQGFSLRVVRSRPYESEKTWSTSSSEKRELRYAPDGVLFAMTTYVFDDNVGIISTEKENFGMVISSRDYSSMMRSLFEVLWATSASG